MPALRKGLLLWVVLSGGCEKEPERSPRAVSPEIAAALQETVALLDSPDPDPREVGRRAEEMAARWNVGGEFSEGLLARPAANTLAEALFLIKYAGALHRTPQALSDRVRAVPTDSLSRIPDSPPLLRAAWILVQSGMNDSSDPEAREVCRKLRVVLWRKLKVADPVVVAAQGRLDACAAAEALNAVLDLQSGAILTVDTAGGMPTSREGAPRYTDAQMEEAVEQGVQGVLSSALADLGIDRTWAEPYHGPVVRRRSGGPLPESAVVLRCRAVVSEGGQPLANWNKSIQLKPITVALTFRFEKGGRPLGGSFEVERRAPEHVSWNEYKEGPDTALLRTTLLGTGVDLKGRMLAARKSDPDVKLPLDPTRPPARSGDVRLGPPRDYPRKVAILQGEAVTEGDVYEWRGQTVMPSDPRERDALLASFLGWYLEERLILTEAAARKMSPGRLMAVDAPLTKDEQEEVDFIVEFNKDKPGAWGGRRNPDVTVRKHLEQKAGKDVLKNYFRKLEAKYQPQVLLEVPPPSK